VNGGGAYRVAAGIFLSRISGLIRERVFAYYFGASLYADVWRASLKLPNILQNLLGEGTLSASFIPLYAEYLEEGREEDAGRFAGAVLGILLVTVGLVVLVGYLLAPLIVTAFFPLWDPAKRSLTIGLVRILLLMAGTLVLSAWALGILNSHRRFFLSYVAPVLWNAAMIAAMIAGGLRWGLGQRDLVIALAWGAVVGGLLQLGVQLPWVVAVLRGFRLRVSTRVTGVREAIRNFLPVVAARGVVNISGYVDLVLAGLLTGGALALLGYAQTLYLLPISLFGMSVAAAELPELSRNRKAELGELNRRVSTAMSRVTYFVWPTTLGYLFLGDVIVAGRLRSRRGGSHLPGARRVLPRSPRLLPIQGPVLGLLRPSGHPDPREDLVSPGGALRRDRRRGHVSPGRVRRRDRAVRCGGAGSGRLGRRMGRVPHAEAASGSRARSPG
jgi:putative peptidoglycan lipid II flippase